MSYSSTILADTPRGYWRMDEASGNPADSSGNSHAVTSVTGTPTYSVAGALSGEPASTAISIPQFGSMSVPDHADFDLGDVFTIEAWVKRISLTADDYQIVSKGANAYAFRINSANQLELLQSTFASLATSTATITDTTTFHHCVVTKNGSARHLYLDSVDVTDTLPSDFTCVDNAIALNFANDPSSGGENNGGVFDEIAIYPTALSAANVLAHFNAASASAITPTMAWIGAAG